MTVRDARTLTPGTRVCWRGVDTVILSERKADDTGWWLADNRGGLADRVLNGDIADSGWEVLSDDGETATTEGTE